MRFLYHSFAGRFSDSPRAIYEALVRAGDDHEHVWIADPAHLAGFPPQVRTVEPWTPECVELLESTDVLVANTHTEVEWDKRPETVYLQTWHGTPLKRIHWDVLWAPEGRLERLQRDVDRWDLLVSPNRTSTPLLRQAFRFEGEVLETGYPRNDVLRSPDRDAIRARVRDQLGIPLDARAVLYAPTWRDDVVFARGDGPQELDLDVAAVVDALDGGHLMLRLHYLITGRLETVQHPAVHDVSLHPDISELYLAADVLVTDYSSTMFDFAVTGRPQLFYTYDLAAYRDSLRGFYFDFAPVAPGPLLETTPELVDALGDLDGVTARYAERYAAFQERFAHLEDGRATERVIERVLTTRAARGA